MNRKITALGLALVAALAFSALTASAASAQNKTHHITASEPWVPTVSAVNAQEFRATTPDQFPSYSCKKVSATHTDHVGTTVDTIAVTPKYEECEAFKDAETTVAAHVEPGKCEYVFKSKTTAGNPTGGEHANVEIRNHENTASPCTIEVKVTAFKFKCASVPNQVIDHAVRYKQVENHIEIEATAHGFDNNTTNSIACPTKSGGTELHDNGQYTGKVTVKGHDTDLNNVPLQLQQNVTP